MDNTSLESLFHWLSDDIVRFKIKVGFYEKCNSYIMQNVFSAALRAAIMSLSFVASRRTMLQRDHSLVNMHQTV